MKCSGDSKQLSGLMQTGMKVTVGSLCGATLPTRNIQRNIQRNTFIIFNFPESNNRVCLTQCIKNIIISA